MHYKPNVEERKYLRQIVNENKVWIKNAREGPASLMRALSSALHFTEIRHKEIQATAIKFVLEHYQAGQLKHLGRNDSATAKRFAEQPELPEFADLNLEAVSAAYQTRIKLFYVQNDNFCSQVFYKKTSKSFSIFRFNESFYAALFDKQYKQLAGIAQNFVLSIVDGALERAPFQFRNVNNGQYINYDYTAKANTSTSKKDESEQSNFYDYSFNRSECSLNDLSYSFRVSENNSTNSNSVGFYMEGLSSLLRNRHGLVRESDSDSPDNQLKSQSDFLRNRAEHSRCMNESKQLSKELADFSIFAQPEIVTNDQKKFSNFANKVICENNNLQKEVTSLPMGNLFGFAEGPTDRSISIQHNQSIVEQAGGLLFGDDDATVKEVTQEFPYEQILYNGRRVQGKDVSSSHIKSLSPMNFTPIAHPKHNQFEFSLMDSFRPVPDNRPIRKDRSLEADDRLNMKSSQSENRKRKKNLQNESGNESDQKSNFFQSPNKTINSSMDLDLVFQTSGTDLCQLQCIFDPNLSVHKGTLAFYDDKRGFGIIQPEKVDIKNNKQGIFVFRKELQKAGINVRALSGSAPATQLKLAFQLERISDFSAQRTRAVNLARVDGTPISNS